MPPQGPESPGQARSLGDQVPHFIAEVLEIRLTDWQASLIGRLYRQETVTDAVAGT
jgi:hypothetical protein